LRRVAGCLPARRATGARGVAGALSLAALAAGAAGCGEEGARYASADRPAAPITVTAAVTGGRVRVSPAKFGAGPILIIVSNQSGAAQQLTFETNELGGDEVGLRRTTGPIEDRSTATLQADVREGTYRLKTADRAIRPAAVLVGAARASAQSDLLQP
jgi:hypothetical protein